MSRLVRGRGKPSVGEVPEASRPEDGLLGCEDNCCSHTETETPTRPRLGIGCRVDSEERDREKESKPKFENKRDGTRHP